MRNASKQAQGIIKALATGNFYAECPCCNTEISLRNAGLFYLDDFTPQAKELYAQKELKMKTNWKSLKEARKFISKRSEVGASSINIGKIVERFAPSMPNFPFDANDCRSLFEPIDYVIFSGLDKKKYVDKIIFADIKTGNASLNSHQREIRALVEKGEVGWSTYKTKDKVGKGISWNNYF